MAGTTGRKRRKEQTEYFFDYSLLFIVLFLLGFGMIMLYSTSSYQAAQDFNDSAYWLKKQIFAVVLGLILMIITANIPYQFWRKFAVIGYIVSAVLILLIIPFGREVKGAKRWIYIGGISLQPAEVAKLGMILFLASLICTMGRSILNMKGFMLVFALPLPIVLMVWKITQNLSSAIIILGISVLMLFVASPHYKYFILGGVYYEKSTCAENCNDGSYCRLILCGIHLFAD